jgi:hypothetical protein
MSIGPARVIASVRTPSAGAALARLTYTSPARFGGTVQAPLAKGVNAVPPGSPPLENAQDVAPVAVDVSWTELPAAGAGAPAAAGVVMVRAGKGVMARFEPCGQDSMKPAARVKTLRIPRGVSKAEGMAMAFAAVRMKVWWRDSTVTMEAATPRMAFDWTNGAAPRYLRFVRYELVGRSRNTYADTPTFSKMLAVATIPAASVKPNLYVQGATG